MELLWQLAPEPVICFDGDRAGEAAAARAIDRKLPNLREGHSFRFAFLPNGQDPDDLVRSSGPRALAECLAGAAPLIEVLWRRELSAHPVDTPERRAALEARLDALLAGIANARVREHYRREVKNRLFGLWRERQPARASSPRAPVSPRGPSAAQARSAPLPPPSAYGFAAALTLALINHPWLLDRFAEEVATLEIRDRKLAGLLGFVSQAIFADHDLTRERLVEAVGGSPHSNLLERLLRESPFARLGFVQPEAPRAVVEEQFADLIFRFRALPSLSRELEEGADGLAETSDAEFERFAALQQQVASVGLRHEADDAGDRDAAKRFHETLARLKTEGIAKRRGRRPEKYR
jgi:DNA primase